MAIRPVPDGGEREDAADSWLTADGGWSSEVTGIGTSRDRATTVVPRHDGPLDDEVLESLYHDDDVAARCCELRPHEMLRRGFRFQVQPDDEAGEEGLAESAELATAVQTWADEVRLVEHLTDAMVWANVFGGAALFVGAEDGLPVETPLDERRLRTIRFLTVLDRRYLVVERYQDDPLLPNYGDPALYRFVPQEGHLAPRGLVLIHASRLVRFDGVRTSRRLRRQNGGWSYSLLQRVFRIFQLFASSWMSVGHRMTDWSMPVWGMQGLKTILSGPNKAELSARMTVMERYRSVVRAALIEKDKESFEFQQARFEGVVDVLTAFSERLSAAAGIPRTVLFGTSPAGLNATGESDTRHWYDSIAREREIVLKPRLERVLKLAFLAQDGPTGGVEPDTWDVSFPPLWEPTPKEQAELRKLVAETDQVWVNVGEVTPEEAALSHFRPEGFDPEIQIDRAARDEPAEPEPEPVPQPAPGSPPGQQPPPPRERPPAG